MNNREKKFENNNKKNWWFFDKIKNKFSKKLCDTFNCKHHHKFIDLNDTVSYWISWWSTLHIHLIPKDISNTLKNPEEFKKCELDFIDALEQIKEIMKKDSSLKVVYAVSPLVRKNTKIGDLFEKYQFDVKSMSREEAYNDDELSYFVKHIFTDEKNTKHTSKIWRAALSRDIFFSEEWENLKLKNKNELIWN